MREVLIKAIPFDDLKITELEGVQQVNEHGELVFSGHLCRNYSGIK